MYLVLLVFLMIFNYCQSVEEGWKGIKPFSSNKEFVNKVLGKPSIDDNNYYKYETDETLITVNYAESPCSKTSAMGRGKYSIPQDTVLSYSVRFKNKNKLSDFEFDFKKYDKDTSGDVLNYHTYINKDDGISIDVYVENNVEHVVMLRYAGKKELVEKHKCI